MFINYESHLSQSPPARPQDLASAAVQMSRSPWKGYGSAHQDAMRSLGGDNYVLYGLAAARANNDFGLQEQRALNDLTLGGLQSLGQQRQNMNNLANSRAGMMSGIYNSLLSGLYG